MSEMAVSHAPGTGRPEPGRKALAELAAAARHLRRLSPDDPGLGPLLALALLKLTEATEAAECLAARQAVIEDVFSAGRTDMATEVAARASRAARPSRRRLHSV